MKNNEKIHTNKEKKEKCTQMNKYRKLTQRAPGSRRQCRYMRSLSEGPSLLMRTIIMMMMMMVVVMMMNFHQVFRALPPCSCHSFQHRSLCHCLHCMPDNRDHYCLRICPCVYVFVFVCVMGTGSTRRIIFSLLKTSTCS